MVWGDFKLFSNYFIVGSDNYLGGRFVIEYLLNKGVKNILFLGDFGYVEIGECYWGYLDVIVSVKVIFYVVFIDIISGVFYKSINKFLVEKGLYFDGIMVCSDMVVFGVMKVLKECYISILNDVVLVGFDDIVMVDISYFFLLSIK